MRVASAQRESGVHDGQSIAADAGKRNALMITLHELGLRSVRSSLLHR
jgi:hypothetical protein